MDSVNRSDWNNESNAQQTHVNGSIALLEGDASKIVYFPSVAIFLMSLLGLPGNVLVFVVYVRKMTTSTRAYMFALAVADSAVCVCGIILSSVPVTKGTALLVLISSETLLFFSILLLAFVSTERLVAVRRPHTFSLSASRARLALVVIAVLSAVCTTFVVLSYTFKYILLMEVFIMCLTFSTVVVMIVCYVAIAVTMLKRMKTARTRVGVQNVTQSAQSGPSSVSTNVNAFSISMAHKTSEQHQQSTVLDVSKASANKTKTYKSVLVLFTVTVVYIVSWLPMWLSFTGMYVSETMQRAFLLNSSVNPFIYSTVSAMFRNDVQQFYRDVRSKLASCFQ